MSKRLIPIVCRVARWRDYPGIFCRCFRSWLRRDGCRVEGEDDQGQEARKEKRKSYTHGWVPWVKRLFWIWMLGWANKATDEVNLIWLAFSPPSKIASGGGWLNN